jgi:MFS family permease
MMRFRGTFKSLKIRNYRLYFDGQALSMTGTWMQRVGTAWLVLELTGSGTLLGVTMALQELPTLLIGPWGGLLADRRDKRQLLLWTQSVAGLLALALAVLVSTGLIEVWMVMALAFAYGITSALAWPARQSFVPELVGPQLLTNAILLNSVTTNVAKAVGPALAGILIATVGLATTFYANAVSYVAVVLALVFMRRAELLSSAPARRVRGQLREGLVYVRSNPLLLGVLMLMSVSGMLAYEWTVTLPLFARDAFGGDADTFGIMFSAMGCGAVLGGTLAASGRPPTAHSLLAVAAAFSILVLVVASSQSLPLAIAALTALGAASMIFRSRAMTLLQLRSAPEMRGRVMALLAMALTGTTTVGGPLVGWIAEVSSPRYALALGGVATLSAALLVSGLLRRGEAEFRARLEEQVASAASNGVASSAGEGAPADG